MGRDCFKSSKQSCCTLSLKILEGNHIVLNRSRDGGVTAALNREHKNINHDVTDNEEVATNVISITLTYLREVVSIKDCSVINSFEVLGWRH